MTSPIQTPAAHDLPPVAPPHPLKDARVRAYVRERPAREQIRWPHSVAIGTAIRKLRKRHGLPMVEVSTYAGINPDTLHRYELGDAMYRLTVLRIVAAITKARLTRQARLVAIADKEVAGR